MSIYTPYSSHALSRLAICLGMTLLHGCSSPASTQGDDDMSLAPDMQTAMDLAMRDAELMPDAASPMPDEGPDLADPGIKAPPVAPSTGCGQSSPWTPGETSIETIQRDGQERSWHVKLPESYVQDEPLPVLFALHGGFGSAERTADTTRFDTIAAQERVIMIYPNGYAKRPDASSDLLKIRAWNAGSCCGSSQEEDVDDVGFLLEILDDVESRACVDRRRVSITGMSNGGMMSYRMACEASGRFAAFAPVASSLVLDACDPARAVPLLHIHGLKDPNVPFEGGAGCGPGTLEQSQPVEEVVATWSARHGCMASQTTTLDREDVTCVVSDGCEERVQLCTLPRGGHVWPGGPEGSAVSSPSCPEDKGYVASFDASQTIMDFVLSHALEQLPE